MSWKNVEELLGALSESESLRREFILWAVDEVKKLEELVDSYKLEYEAGGDLARFLTECAGYVLNPKKENLAGVLITYGILEESGVEGYDLFRDWDNPNYHGEE